MLYYKLLGCKNLPTKLIVYRTIFLKSNSSLDIFEGTETTKLITTVIQQILPTLVHLA